MGTQINYYCYLLLFKAIALIPLSLLYLVSNLMYYILYDVIHYRRNIVRTNLSNCFPEKNINEILCIEQKFYHHFCDLFLETIKLLHVTEKDINDRIVVDNTELIEKSALNNRPIILYLGHYGNWEWVTAVSQHYQIPKKTFQIYKPLRNKAFNLLMLKIRSRFNTISVSQKTALRSILNTHKQMSSLIVGCIADGRPNKKTEKGPGMKFLNQQTDFMVGAELIGRKIGATFLYLDVTKQARGKYRFTVKELIPAEEDKQYPYTKAFYRMLEKTITREPSYWLWTHNRWLHNQ